MIIRTIHGDSFVDNIIHVIMFWYFRKDMHQFCEENSVIFTRKKHVSKSARERGMFYGINKPEISQPKIENFGTVLHFSVQQHPNLT